MTQKRLHVDEPPTQGDPPEGSEDDLVAHPWKTADEEADWLAFGERVREHAKPGETRQQCLRRLVSESVTSHVLVALGWND